MSSPLCPPASHTRPAVLDGCAVTVDAMGCLKRIAQTVRDPVADHVLVLKGNQPQLHAAVVETFTIEQAEGFEDCDHDFHQTVNKNHGRIETRRCWVIGAPEYLRYVDPGGLWPDLHSLVMIEAQRRQGSEVASGPAATFRFARRCADPAAGCAQPLAGTLRGWKPSALDPGYGLPGG